MFEGNGLDAIKDYTYTALNSLISAYWAMEGEQSKFEVSDEPVYILGEKYDTRENIEGAQHDVLSRVWMTYRKFFPSLGEPGNFTSDRGWGCMLRCGQMLLAEALVRVHLGRSWRWLPSCCDEKYLRIVRLFEDHPAAPYSLHVMTSVGKSTGKNVGEWFGPNTVAHLIKRLPESEEWSNFAVSVSINNMLIVDQTRALSKCGESWKPLLLLLPLRLGVDVLNDIYIETLQRFFQVPQGLGVLGGTPSHALFLIGYVGKDVIYLDPHTTQDSVSVGQKETDEERQADLTYHCHSTPRMPFIRLDPSIAMCFLCKTEEEYDDLIARLRCNLHPVSGDLKSSTASTSHNTLIEVMDTLPHYMKEDYTDEDESDLVTEDTYSESVDDLAALTGARESPLPSEPKDPESVEASNCAPDGEIATSLCPVETQVEAVEYEKEISSTVDSSKTDASMEGLLEFSDSVEAEGGGDNFVDVSESQQQLVSESHCVLSPNSSASETSDCYRDFEIL